MALVSTSTEVSNQDATPVVKQGPLVKGGVVRTAYGYLASTSFVGGTTGQWYAFVRVPARARVLGVYVSNPTTTSGAVKIGLFRPDSGIAIDDDVFATAFVMGAANNRANAMTVPTPAQRKQSLRDAFAAAITTAGATSDVEYDIVLGIVTVIGTPQNTLVEVDYVLDE